MSFPNGPGGGLTLGGVVATIPASPDHGGWAIEEKVDPATGPEALVTFQLPWAQRGTFIQALLGTCVNVSGSIIRIPAATYPDNPSLIALGVASIRGLQPIGGGPEVWPSATLAEMVVVFGRPSWSIPTEQVFDGSQKPYTTLVKRTAGELRTPPDDTYYYVGRGFVDSATLGIPRGWVEYQLVRHGMAPRVMDSILYAAVNTVNNSPLTLGNVTYPKGYVLCAAAASEPRADAGANVTEDVIVTLIANLDHEHNARQDDDGNWYLVNTKSDGTGNYIYSYVDSFGTFFPDVA